MADNAHKLLEALGGVAPTPGTTDAAGSDAYDLAGFTTRVWTHPGSNAVFTRMLFTLAAGFDADISIDGGVTTNFLGLQPGTYCLGGLRITGDIHGRNNVAGSNYTNLRVIAVW